MSEEAHLLAEMRRQYEYAALETHMLDEDGKVRLRCGRCKERPVPEGWSFIMACDPCFQEMAARTIRLPHAPMWNLLPRIGAKCPWKCTWHGWIEDERCAACKREHGEYLETGTWADTEPGGIPGAT